MLAPTRILMFACLVVGGVLPSCGRNGDREPRSRHLTEALAEGRWFEARLTGASRHQDCQTMCTDERILCAKSCGEGMEPIAPPREFVRAEQLGPGLDLEKARALAVLQLLSNPPQRETDKAVRVLERLAAQSADDVRLLNDLSAAYLVRAERSDRPLDLVRALNASELAAELAPDFQEARFNQALARENLWLGQASVEAWRNYRAVDSDSDWAKEAQGHLARLENLLAKENDPNSRWDRDRARIEREASAEWAPSLIDLHRTASRQWVERELLPSWAKAEARSDKVEAARLLGIARAVSEALGSLQGDSFLLESVEAIERALNDPSRPSQLQHLIRGHRLFGEASVLSQRFAIEEAATPFREAVNSLRLGGSPFWLKAEIILAANSYQRNEPDESLRDLAEIETQIDGHLTLRARAAWIAALCHQKQLQPLLVVREYRRALELYRAVGERENATNVQIRLAETLDGLGEVELAWRHRYLALEGTQFLRKPLRRHYVFGEAASAALKLGLDRAALLLQNRAVEAASADPVNGSIALTHRAAIHLKMGNLELAKRDLTAALKFADQLRKEVDLPIRAGIEQVRGLMATDPEKAAKHFGEAIRLRRKAQGHDFLALLYARRARAYLAANQKEKAKADLESSISLIEKEWRDTLMDPERQQEISWPVYFDKNQEIFGLLIDLLASEGDHQRAFQVAEQARAREPLDLARRAALSKKQRASLARSLGPKPVEEIQRGLPPGSLLIQYRALENRILIWVLSRDQFAQLECPAPVSEVEEWLQAVYGHLGGWVQERQMLAALENLHKALVPAQMLPSDPLQKLVFVPDGPVHGVPFAALRDPASKRFLIEDHVVAVSPSATLYLLSLTRNRELSGKSADTLLAVANPAFDRTLFPDLADLPGAVREVREIRSRYSGPPPLTGSEATKEEFLSLLGDFSVVHFSGHAIPNADIPSQSLLLLAPQLEDTGALYAFELLKHDFKLTRLVVLSACSTSGGYPIGSIGVSGLVRPFLGGGVPAVVASLWPVGDTRTPPLLTAFHRHFRAGQDASIALRAAQLELLHGSNRALKSVGSWAPFQVIGEASPE